METICVYEKDTTSECFCFRLWINRWFVGISLIILVIDLTSLVLTTNKISINCLFIG